MRAELRQLHRFNQAAAYAAKVSVDVGRKLPTARWSSMPRLNASAPTSVSPALRENCRPAASRHLQV
jgi:hypothetical protein